MHTIRNAFLSYGLMNVPVGVCTATRKQEFAFKKLHAKCLQPITMTSECVGCSARNLQADDLVKGYNYAGTYVVVEDVDLARLKAERSNVIEVSKFVGWDNVPELGLEKSYYLAPSDIKRLAKPYALLSHAMQEAEVIGLGKTVLWGKEYPTAVWPKDSEVLVLSMLFSEGEVVDDSDIAERISSAEVTTYESELASELVAMMTRPFEPSDLRSDQSSRIGEYIASKASGRNFTFADEPETVAATVDVALTLEASIEAVRDRV